MATRLFLHGLDSSGSGTKGTFFSTRYPDMLRPDFEGTLEERMIQLSRILGDSTDLIVVGSSFGGLMGACLAIDLPDRVQRLILLAPALNFLEFSPPAYKITPSRKSRFVIPASLRIPLKSPDSRASLRTRWLLKKPQRGPRNGNAH